MTATRSTVVKPQWRKPLALPLWVSGAVCEFIREAWRGRRRDRSLSHTINSPRWERQSLTSLRQTIIGNGKPTVAAALGMPRAALATKTADSHLDCDLWYYPLCREARWCMAVTFDQGTARDVEFFCGLER